MDFPETNEGEASGALSYMGPFQGLLPNLIFVIVDSVT